ncbi:MAG TPA: DUF480 domain-containing protein [Iamia sp.]|nr:DUF480 domain-containing protein [Iamia sp.]
MDLVLTPVEARVLGGLLEKERTVPATYPLTMKALVSACNQTSSRDPLMDLSEADVEAAVDVLKAHKLVRKVLPSHGNRSVKYRQVAVETLTVDEPQRAVLTVMLLRGPQTPQELKTRTDRLHAFTDVEAVEEVLTDMARWGDPLVRLLPRRPGQRDARWAHLLSGEPDLSAPEPARAGRTAAPAAPAAPPPPVADPAVHGPLAALAGTWTGPGQGRYPTIAGFSYAERLEVVPMPGKPRLAWRVTTRAADDGRGLHAESGFVRLTDDGEVELVLAMGSGLVEVSTGLVEADGETLELVLSSDVVAGTPTAKAVTATERTYRIAGGTLTYEVAMAAVGEPLTPHLTATLTRE